MQTDFRLDIKREKQIIGMIHLAALPGTPGNTKKIDEIIELAAEEARLMNDLGVNAILIENMNDAPYLKKIVGAEITACMTAVSLTLKKELQIPIGIQVLAAANKEALAIAQAANLDFIRVEGFVYGHIGDEGYTESCAGELLRYRKTIGAEHILVFTDVQKKHSSHSITADINLDEHVKTAEYFGSDGIIITGTSTGKSAKVEDVKIASRSTGLPVIIGSGITDSNLYQFWPFADGFIVGSWFKHDGNWKNTISKARVEAFMNTVEKLKLNDNGKESLRLV